MILTCPECATSYFVPDERLGPSGRRVRCHACAHTWRAIPDEPLELIATPDEGAVAVEPADQEFGRRDEPGEVPAPELPKAFRARAEHQRRMRRAAAAGAVWAALGCVFLGLVGAAWLFRVQVVDLYPRAAAAYALVGTPVNPVGLEFETVRARPAANHPGMVLVSGALRNVRDRPLSAPVIRVALLDAEGQEISHQMLTVPAPPIQPGAVLGFATLASDPEARAADIGLAFVPEGAATPQAGPSHAPEIDPSGAPGGATGGATGLRPALEQPADGGLRPALDVEAPLHAVDAEPLDSGAGEAVSAPHHG